MIDPFIAENPRTELTQTDLSPDVVVVTHGHFDHAAEADAFDAPVVAQPEVAALLEERGFENTTRINIGGTVEVAGIPFTMVQAFHSSSLLSTEGTDQYAGMPAGYVIEFGGMTVYHAGDTGLFGDMKTVIGNIYTPDLATVPIGDKFTMGPDQAGRAVDWTGADVDVPMHYDTWPPIEQDPDVFL